MHECNKLRLSKQESLIVLKQAENGKDWRREIRNYYCKQCNAWHTTSKIKVSSNNKKEVAPIEVNRWTSLLIPKDELPEYTIIPRFINIPVNPIVIIFQSLIKKPQCRP